MNSKYWLVYDVDDKCIPMYDLITQHEIKPWLKVASSSCAVLSDNIRAHKLF